MGVRQVRQTERIRPGHQAERYLLREWGMCRFVWNALTAESKSRHQANLDSTFGYADQNKFLTQLRQATSGPSVDAVTGLNWLAEGSSVSQQQAVRDFAKSRKKALLDRKNRISVGQRHGLPRFKSRRTSLPTLNYTRRGFSIRPHPTTGRDALVLPGGVYIPVVWTRELPSEPKSVRVSQDSLGHWYASFVVEIEDTAHHLPPTGRDTVLGIDWGVTTTATTATLDLVTGELDESPTFDLPHAEHGKRAAANLARYQRMMARRRTPKGQANTSGYEKAKKLTAKAHKKVARQRQDDARKWAKSVVSHHDKIAVEDFRPKFLARSTMAKKAADAAIGAVKTELIWMANKHGRDLRLIHPANTTTDCYNCGARTKHRLPLGQRVYICEACQTTRSRDKNSAAVIAARAGFVPANVEGIRLLNPVVGKEQPELGILGIYA